MEEPELRVGGWEKQGGRKWVKRLFSLTVVVFLGTILLGPNAVDYRPAYVSSDSLYFPTTWNGPFDIQYSKEFNGHLKISSISYEASDSKSGKMAVISISSLIDLSNLNTKAISTQSIVVEKVESQAMLEGVNLKSGTGKILNTEFIENHGVYANVYQWDANVTDSANFFLGNGIGSEILVKAYSWTIEKQSLNFNNGSDLSQLQSQTIICIVFGIDNNAIEQATEMIGNIKI
ncbi:MAG: hypothetical protein BET99_02710 [Marine Group III euryarchaeote CG-Epi2]|uniref:Uncharacterized protein n=1 Tax=Marine Group III euryarchaeote CG-Epi2 TaxID=1888996 RepID=A0A1J5TXX2_9ARCH|nr:MAG: hypothetical protein BET99_02710 [Marine Group III euryarchaeote CG-Epi2]|tara:strand:- start:2786 stop:3484 length:699 start_codon:yes stop_codon:yes gene_type:complete